ncbi:antitoxin VbhA family protein [Pseudalkalibacillus salsuginis]|uniref:antitoxin VbhA family protein n=1 Tax=Pseudalkalibacillus salsuginis TaxID=2910972 RepID=UPI001F1FCC65|nr:antitoxin VbhA family protein [Pseudalkalibacillus salsuginis]MCF6409966.1 antitoxin VbhA family protein [Pseudalkalibacillus salsuginis]
MKKEERINKAVRSAKASLAIEGMHLSDKEESLIKQRLNGDISENEFKKKVMDY